MSTVSNALTRSGTTWLDDRTLPWLLSLPIPVLWAIWISRPKPAHPTE